MKARKKLFFILMIMWMAGIFMFSARSGNESALDSYLAGNMIGKLFVPGRSGQVTDVIPDSVYTDDER